MRIEEIYRARLKQLIDEAGSQTTLAASLGKSPAQISQWMNASKDSKTGKPRVMNRTTAREIEKKCGKPDGWMDQPIGDSDDRALHSHQVWPLGDQISPEDFFSLEQAEIQPAIDVLKAAIRRKQLGGAGNPETGTNREMVA